MANVFDTGCEYDPDDPDGYRSGVAHVGREAGGTANTVKLFETPPGQSMWSSSREPAVAVYPDSDKIGVWPGNEADTLLLRRADGARGYYDGEP